MTKLRFIKATLAALIAAFLLTTATGCFYDRDHHDDHDHHFDDHR